jgi:hypothetical protein
MGWDTAAGRRFEPSICRKRVHSITATPCCWVEVHGITATPCCSVQVHGITDTPCCSVQVHGITDTPCCCVQVHGITATPCCSVQVHGITATPCCCVQVHSSATRTAMQCENCGWEEGRDIVNRIVGFRTDGIVRPWNWLLDSRTLHDNSEGNQNSLRKIWFLITIFRRIEKQPCVCACERLASREI